MSGMIIGKVIRRKDYYVYVDTTGDGRADKSIFCDNGEFINIPRFNNKRFSYYDAYAVMHPGDIVSFTVNLTQERANKSYLIKATDLAGEPTVNGQNAFTLRLYRQMQEIRALIAKDNTFTIEK